MKNKIKKIINNNKWIIITFFVSLVVISIIYALNKVAPFGNNSLLTVDFYHQYGPMLNELVDRIRSGESFLYSFNTGGGIPFYRNFLNYLSSPFNVILLFLKKDSIVMGYSLIIALKTIFAATFMSYFLKKAFKKDGILLVAFGLLYSYSGYFCAYYWNIMWLDGIVFLPLIVLGIIKIIDDKKPLLYIISLAIMLFSNYFIGYMICIYSVLFFIGYFIYKGNFKIKNILKTCLLFGVSSLLAAGLCAFALLPLFKSLSSISATKDTFPALEANFNILKYYFNHISGVTPTVFASDVLPLPNVHSGLVTMFMVIILFFNGKVKIRVKIITILTLLLFLLFFDVSKIDFIWHAFHVPNDLPWRYSFLYVFSLVSIAFYSITKIKEVKAIFIYIISSLLVIFVLLSLKFNFENIDDSKVIVCIILIACYLVLGTLYIYKRFPNLILGSVFVLIISFEVIYGINVNWGIDHDIKVFMSDKKDFEKLIKKARKDDNGLYRIEKTNTLTLNDGAWYDYSGMSTFSSMAYEDVSRAQRKLGLSGNTINSYYYHDVQTPIYNTMFNIKYLLGDYVLNSYYIPEDSVSSYNLVKYKYPSSIAYLVNNSIDNMNLVTFDPFLNQSNFVRLYTDEKDIYEKVPIKDVISGEVIYEYNGNYNIKVDDDFEKLNITLDNTREKNIYLYLKGDISSYYIDNKYYSITSDEYYTVDIGRKKTDDVSIDINLNSHGGIITLCAYTINDDVFNEFYEKLDMGKLNVTSYNDTIINGNIDAQYDGTIFTSIAYDEGWNVYVDGKKVKTKKLLDSYLGFAIDKGKHKIKLSYYPIGLKQGIVITFISMIIIFTYQFIIGNNKKIRKR